MTARFLRGLPLGLGAAVWAGLAVLLLVNLLLPMIGRGGMKLAPALAGVIAPEQPLPGWDSVLQGGYQSAYARLIGSRMPLYPFAVRLRNQVEYTVFGVSGTPAVAVGPGPRLFEVAYADEYCARDVAAWHATAVQWAGRIREMQDIVERRGHAFLYVLTPSKVAQYPDVLPGGYSCPAPPADRTGFVPAWLAALHGAGVHVADTTAVMLAAQGAYPFRMFPPGGSHWNAVGSALSEQAVMRELDRLVPGGGFAPFTFTWHMVRHATGLDIDIARLMNLIRTFPAGPVPAVDIQPAPPPQPCPNTRVVVVGGSFSHALLEYLHRTTCNPPAVEYEYWRIFTLRWNDRGPEVQPGVDEERRNADILAADVLVYEENEQVLPAPRHGWALYDFLHGLPAP